MIQKIELLFCLSWKAEKSEKSSVKSRLTVISHCHHHVVAQNEPKDHVLQGLQGCWSL